MVAVAVDAAPPLPAAMVVAGGALRPAEDPGRGLQPSVDEGDRPHPAVAPLRLVADLLLHVADLHPRVAAALRPEGGALLLDDLDRSVLAK